MRLQIRVEIDHEHIVWAIWYLINMRKEPLKPNRDRVLRFLRSQIEQFGTEPVSLFGSTYNEAALCADVRPRYRARCLARELFPEVE